MLLCDPAHARVILLAGNGLKGDIVAWRELFERVDEGYAAAAAAFIEAEAKQQPAFRVMLPRFYPRPSHPYLIDRWFEPVVFPPSQRLNVNMMPFLLFDKSSLPVDLHPYYSAFVARVARFSSSFARIPQPDAVAAVAYLTVHESDVPAGRTQRRPGLHIERPVPRVNAGTGRIVREDDGDESATALFRSISWGMGYHQDGWPTDGIFMASNVDDSCAVYPSKVTEPERLADAHGGLCAVLKDRGALGRPTLLKAGQICWLTDCTPHESLPVKDDVHRQFVRLVVGPIGAWYAEHSTCNPMGVVPPDGVQIVQGSKFAV